MHFNSLPNDKFQILSKFKAIADDKKNVNQKQKIFLGWVENIVGKEENAGYQHFLFFPQYFQKASSSGSLKVRIVWKRVKMLSAICFNLDQSKILSSGNGLTVQ